MTARVSIWCSTFELTDADATVQNPFTEQAVPNSHKCPACRWTDIINDAEETRQLPFWFGVLNSTGKRKYRNYGERSFHGRSKMWEPVFQISPVCLTRAVLNISGIGYKLRGSAIVIYREAVRFLDACLNWTLAEKLMALLRRVMSAFLHGRQIDRTLFSIHTL